MAKQFHRYLDHGTDRKPQSEKTECRKTDTEHKDTEANIQELRDAIAKHREHLDAFNRSVKQAERVLRQRGRAVIDWIGKHVEEKVALAERQAEDGVRKKLTRDIKDAEAKLRQLGNVGKFQQQFEKREATATPKPPKRLVTDHQASEAGTEFAKAKSTLGVRRMSDDADAAGHSFVTLRRQAETSALRDGVFKAPTHSSHVHISDSFLVRWKKCLQDFIGSPAIAQTSETSTMAVALKLTITVDNQAQVFALRVVDEECIIVAVTTDDPAKGLLKLYSQSKGAAEEIKMTQSCRLLLSSGKLVLLYTRSGQTTLLDSTRVTRFLSNVAVNIDQTSSDRAYTFKKKSDKAEKRKKSVSTPEDKKEQYEVYEVTGSSMKHVFDILAVHPQAIRVDSAGKFCAVIQTTNCVEEEIEKPQATASRCTFYDNTPTVMINTQQRSSIAIFKLPDSRKSSSSSKMPEPLKPTFTITSYSPDDSACCSPSDMCFCKLDLTLEEEVLVIADATNNRLLVVKLSDDQQPKSLSPLVANCPLMDTPTCLTTDRYGRLWVGCKGGKILTLVPKAETTEGYMDYCMSQLNSLSGSLISRKRSARLGIYATIQDPDSRMEDGSSDDDYYTEVDVHTHNIPACGNTNADGYIKMDGRIQPSARPHTYVNTKQE